MKEVGKTNCDSGKGGRGNGISLPSRSRLAPVKSILRRGGLSDCSCLISVGYRVNPKNSPCI